MWVFIVFSHTTWVLFIFPYQTLCDLDYYSTLVVVEYLFWVLHASLGISHARGVGFTVFPTLLSFSLFHLRSGFSRVFTLGFLCDWLFPRRFGFWTLELQPKATRRISSCSASHPLIIRGHFVTRSLSPSCCSRANRESRRMMKRLGPLRPFSGTLGEFFVFVFVFSLSGVRTFLGADQSSPIHSLCLFSPPKLWLILVSLCFLVSFSSLCK